MHRILTQCDIILFFLSLDILIDLKKSLYILLIITDDWKRMEKQINTIAFCVRKLIICI